MSEKNKEQFRGYGFSANVREEPSSVIIRINWLEKLIKTSYSVTAKRSLLGTVFILMPIVFAWFYLTADGTRGKFLFFSILVLIVSLVFWVALYVFIDPSSGSLLAGSIRMLHFIIDYIKVKAGRKPKYRKTGTNMVYSDGTIEFLTGDFGRMFFMDGKTSATSYPEEILAQEELCVSYHNARNSTTTEIKITSSQKQNADRQRANFAKEKSLNKGNKAIQDIVALQDLFVERAVEGKKSQIVQYLIVRDSSQNELDKHIKRLQTYNNRGMYYSLVACNKRETESVLQDMFWLR